MGGKGGGDTYVQAPAVDPAQQQLEQAQAAALDQQNEILKLNQALAEKQQKATDATQPLLYAAMGFTPTYDEQGNLISLTQTPNAAADQQAANLQKQGELTGLLLDQQKAALTGQLPVNPLVTQELDKQQQQLSSTIRANLGPGGELSTPGQQAQNTFDVTRAGVIQSANTGQMTLDQQLASAGSANTAQIGSNIMAPAAGINSLGFNTIGAYGQLGQGYGQLSQGYGQAQSPYITRSQQQLAANTQNAQTNIAAQQASGQATGQAIGAAVSIAALALML